MKNKSETILKNNLSNIMHTKYSSINKMAEDLSMPVGTLKCWITGNRIPRLTSLDSIANQLGCHTYNLIDSNGDFSNIGINDNNIHNAFVRQLLITFINHQSKTYLNKLFLLNNVISYDTLVSYLRHDNYRMPSLHTLDRIADELGINAYELIKEDL